MGSRRMKLEEEQDRISDLPDSLIHHILSFLPSTKEAIHTGILSKRWLNQWTRVPFLIFDFNSGTSSDNSVEDFARAIDSILLQHDCPKIKKLHLAYDFTRDINFTSKIQFATRKHVEELSFSGSLDHPHLLPEFLFDNASLVKLDLSDCYFLPDWSINWGSLKTLRMEGFGCKDMVANVLYGSPLLESLELETMIGDGFVIASNLLKILVLRYLWIPNDNLVKISCPNLEKLAIKSSYVVTLTKTIESVVSTCASLRSLELDIRYPSPCRLVIASKSLKKLELTMKKYDLTIPDRCVIEIACPNLEEFKSYGLSYETIKSMNTPSLIFANLDFEISQFEGCEEDMAKQIFGQLQNVKKLRVQVGLLSFIRCGDVIFSMGS